jgi:hypothetical protein
MDFDLFGDQKKPSAEEAQRLEALARRAKRRRSMLNWHQGLGFVTLAALAATLIVGQLHYVDRFDGDFTNRYSTAHWGLATGTSLLFTTTAVLALAAPNPYPKPLKLDGAFVHKASMALAAACFVTQIILGPIALAKEGTLLEKPLAQAHLGVGWASLGLMTMGTLSYVFK